MLFMKCENCGIYVKRVKYIIKCSTIALQIGSNKYGIDQEMNKICNLSQYYTIHNDFNFILLQITVGVSEETKQQLQLLYRSYAYFA